MNALYVMKYTGTVDYGFGVLYIGKGHVLGSDVGGIRYKGTYTEKAGHLEFQMTISAAEGATGLVSGKTLSGGETLSISANLPLNFDNGHPHSALVDGAPINVEFEKIGNIP